MNPERREPFHLQRAVLRFAAVALVASTPVSALRAQQPAADTSVRGLPIIEVPAKADNPSTLAIFISGDGGWADIDRTIAKVLTERGIAVVGVNARDYLSSRKKPEQAASDVARIARVYGARWGTQRLVLIGYSRGADMLPFVTTRLPADVRERVSLGVMLGLAPMVNFQFHLVDLVRDVRRPDDLPTAPELERLRGLRMACVYGSDEKESACRDADSTLITKVERRGGHHFDGNFRSLGELIVGWILPAGQ